jgi:hypothetical protein
MPFYTVPKPHSTDLRLVTDQSHGEFSPNSMIPRHKVTGFPLDNLVHFRGDVVGSREEGTWQTESSLEV